MFEVDLKFGSVKLTGKLLKLQVRLRRKKSIHLMESKNTFHFWDDIRGTNVKIFLSKISLRIEFVKEKKNIEASML